MKLGKDFVIGFTVKNFRRDQEKPFFFLRKILNIKVKHRTFSCFVETVNNVCFLALASSRIPSEIICKAVSERRTRTLKPTLDKRL